MCYKIMLYTVYSCNHAFPEPPEGMRVDCGNPRCRVSTEHPSNCSGTYCVQNHFQYMTQPQSVPNRHLPYPCPHCHGS
ncbi:hypothetical protein BOTBODRAFT_55757 [Botryobasidium botryosum FD-172 SS1]|uniref:Uncharacterized protein n=1 Tax=Botryobasidium botryosum (strain FD-172 SS1) TaxID=930990 RepID=A0A067ME32_BOTB1|nr:hypothetical protein BOTBODRAFT_55757 [Botryobasidium botryosum FD-172 SS1]